MLMFEPFIACFVQWINVVGFTLTQELLLRTGGIEQRTGKNIFFLGRTNLEAKVEQFVFSSSSSFSCGYSRNTFFFLHAESPFLFFRSI